MDKDKRELLKKLVDHEARIRAASGFADCDPESLSIRALEAEELGYDEIASGLRNFRDLVVNRLLAEGWVLERIEMALYQHFRGQQRR